MNGKMILVGLSLLASGCASHFHREGTVVFTDSPKEAHACLNHKGLSAGEEVNVYRGECKTSEMMNGEKGAKVRTTCTKNFLGKGKIIELSDEHFARIESIGDLTLETGLIVEAIPK